jgi:hypothetical protein
MNIIEMEDMVKGLPDQLLMQEAQAPSGRIPQFLALSEVQRRKEMRDRFQQQAPQATVKDQILQSGIAAALPQGPPGMPPQMPPQGQPPAPPMAPPQGPMMAYGGGQMPYFMYGGGQVPYRMQQGRTVPDFQNLVSLPQFGGNRNSNLLAIEELLKIPEELRTPEQNQIIASLMPVMEEFPITPPAPQVPETIAAPAMAPTSASVAPPAAGAAPPGAVGSFLQNVAPIQEFISRAIPATGGVDFKAFERAAAPARSDYINPEYVAARDKMRTDLLAEGQKRREADLALAQRYMSEAEAPIKAAEAEAKKAALGAVLTRLGAGLMQGDAAAGLAMATESAEKILGRSREMTQAERRAVKQEFRTAEREAIRSERGSIDQAFNMQAQNLLADENAQRMFVRDSKSFAKDLFGLMRDAGKDARTAQMESLRTAFTIAQAVDQATRDERREAGLTDRQYAQTFSSVFDNVIKALEDTDFVDPKTGESRAPTGEELLDLANRKASEILTTRGIRPPGAGSAVQVRTQDELNKLAPGTPYIYVGPGSDNKVRTKP